LDDFLIIDRRLSLLSRDNFILTAVRAREACRTRRARFPRTWQTPFLHVSLFRDAVSNYSAISTEKIDATCITLVISDE